MSLNFPKFSNPFRPGAGHMPPYLAGRQSEANEFEGLLDQKPVLKNLILSGLRGVGKTVLLESFRPLASAQKWAWVGTDLSEAVSTSEHALAIRLLADVAVIGSTIGLPVERRKIGFKSNSTETITLNYRSLVSIYEDAPGLVADKLKAVLELLWHSLETTGIVGVVFAYDEAQNLGDLSKKDQYPLSILLDVFQSLQRKGAPFLLVLTGLPTLFPKLVEARTYSERMFHQIFLNALGPCDSRDAILTPIQNAGCPVTFGDVTVNQIIDLTAGYPYFIQFVCKEVFDIWIQQLERNQKPGIPAEELVRKLDADFFSGRWARATDRQRDLLVVAANLPNCDAEFTTQEIVAGSQAGLSKPFSTSHVNQLLKTLAELGFVFKNRHGKYSFAVPLFGQFIKRQIPT